MHPKLREKPRSERQYAEGKNCAQNCPTRPLSGEQHSPTCHSKKCSTVDWPTECADKQKRGETTNNNPKGCKITQRMPAAPDHLHCAPARSVKRPSWRTNFRVRFLAGKTATHPGDTDSSKSPLLPQNEKSSAEAASGNCVHQQRDTCFILRPTFWCRKTDPVLMTHSTVRHRFGRRNLAPVLVSPSGFSFVTMGGPGWSDSKTKLSRKALLEKRATRTAGIPWMCGCFQSRKAAPK